MQHSTLRGSRKQTYLVNLVRDGFHEGPRGLKLVFMILVSYANCNDICWPSVRTIAQKAGLRESQVKKYMRILRKGRWIRGIANSAGGCHQSSRRYLINREKLATGISDDTRWGVTSAQHGYRQRYMGGIAGDTQRTNEHILNKLPDPEIRENGMKTLKSIVGI